MKRRALWAGLIIAVVLLAAVRLVTVKSARQEEKFQRAEAALEDVILSHREPWDIYSWDQWNPPRVPWAYPPKRPGQRVFSFSRRLPHPPFLSSTGTPIQLYVRQWDGGEYSGAGFLPHAYETVIPARYELRVQIDNNHDSWQGPGRFRKMIERIGSRIGLRIGPKPGKRFEAWKFLRSFGPNDIQELTIVGPITPECRRAIGRLKGLKALTIWGKRSDPESLASFSLLPNLERIALGPFE